MHNVKLDVILGGYAYQCQELVSGGFLWAPVRHQQHDLGMDTVH